MSKKRSGVWTVFTELGGASNKDKAKCDTCKEVLSIKGGSTANLKRHLKRKHPFLQLERQTLPETEDLDVDVIQDIANGNQSTSGNQSDTQPTSSAQPSEPVDKSSTQPTSTEDEPSIQSSSKGDESNSRCQKSPPTQQGPKHPGNTSAVPTTSRSQSAQPGQHQAPKHSGKTSFVQSNMREFANRPVPPSKKKSLDRLLARFLCKGYHPISLVEEEAFRELVYALNPNYQLPTRKTVTNTLIPQEYERGKEVVEKELKEASVIAITTDGWKCKVTKQDYQTITAHFINNECELKSYMLGMIEFDESHTAENLAAMVRDVLKQWNVHDKVVCANSDNASNILAALREAGFNQINCFCHNLNLAVKAALKEVETEVGKVKETVTHFRRSTSDARRLTETQVQMGLPQLKMKNDCDTRWNSTEEMIERALKSKNAIISTVAVHCPKLPQLTEQEWTVLQQTCEFLEPFKTATVEMSGEKVVTMSKAHTIVDALLDHCHNTENSLEVDVKVSLMASKAKGVLLDFKEMKNRYHYAESAFLDPRFKKAGIPGNLYEQTKRNVITKCGQIKVPQSTEPPPPEKKKRPEEEKHDKLWTKFDKQVKPLLEDKNRTAAHMIEVDRYLKEDLLPRDGDPLKWWKERRATYPRLYEMMRRRLCIPASSVPSERIFSKSGQLITARRSRLLPKRVHMILFIHANM